MPLIADENTYYKIASNLLNGKYYLKDYPSTVTPTIPFIVAFFKTTASPIIGIILHKILHVVFAILGFRYLFLFLSNLELGQKIVFALVALSAVNPIGIAFYGRLYPEGILMFSFWGFMYYATANIKTGHFIKMLLFFVILVLTRYLYAVLGVIIVYNLYRYYKAQGAKSIYKLGLYCVVFSIPVLFWAKYVYIIEQEVTSEEVSYFKRFKSENPIVYNIKAGLGLIKHEEVRKVNGIPAFASLFVPIDSYRNYWLSIGLVFAFLAGYFSRKLMLGEKILATAIILTMLGLIFAGTGFSRYWLILLPGYLLGFYYLIQKFEISEKWIIYGIYTLCIIYIINEFRLDYLILNRYL
ncbi:hypothetical protein [Winogradskyella alexanderae]|uniref:Glycosyltransferase RgtA/B/C/D-like domain-containing protein n=1 Tax=Winogradskyella alexanderae TaxID=2877123 RepID=A0ABS7XQF0_9FLAO|nr:hypothetical protein [Winogradskyella alexanderae]MCA0132000.1 hypothetical protein [Winogradskyella alexanderae]